jgi:hypothetical protein
MGSETWQDLNLLTAYECPGCASAQRPGLRTRRSSIRGLSRKASEARPRIQPPPSAQAESHCRAARGLTLPSTGSVSDTGSVESRA